MIKELNYVKDENENMKVDISMDSKCIIFANGKENFFLELQGTNNFIQRKISLNKN